MSSTPYSPRETGAAENPRRRRDFLLLIALILLVLFGLAGLAVATGWEETIAGLSSLSAGQLVILLVLSLVNYLLRGMRWHLFATRLTLPLAFFSNIRHFIGGFAMSVTPGRVGELVRMRWIRRETGWPFDKTAPLVLVDRAADLAAMAILLAISVTQSMSGVSGAVPVALLAIIAAFVVTRPKLLRALGDLGFRLSGKRLPRLFARVRRAAKSLSAFNAPTTLVYAGFLGVVGWLAEGYAFHLLLEWMGADVPLWSAIGIFIFATLAGGLTGAPGGLGGAEAAMVGLLALQGVPLEVALPATLIIRVTTLWFAFGLGFLLFPLAERASKKVEDGRQTN